MHCLEVVNNDFKQLFLPLRQLAHILRFKTPHPLLDKLEFDPHIFEISQTSQCVLTLLLLNIITLLYLN